MMDEVGAVVLDLKTMGDQAIDKWSGRALNEKKNSKSKSII